jgi:uncharacterized protein (TIGR03435 family)
MSLSSNSRKQRQLGLKLEPKAVSMEIVVIDHVERRTSGRAKASPRTKA